jgi:large subunit ribosomal protein L10
MVEDLGQIFANAGSVVVAHYSGLTVAEISDLRTRMRAAGARFKVAKNRLAKIALANTDRSAAADLFVGPTGIAYSDDPVSAAKVATQYAKDNAKLVIIGGIVGAVRLDAKGVDDLARMPSLDELRARLLGALMAPGAMLARVLAAPGTNLVRTLAAPGTSLVGVLNAKMAKDEAA